MIVAGLNRPLPSVAGRDHSAPLPRECPSEARSHRCSVTTFLTSFLTFARRLGKLLDNHNKVNLNK